jgi:hypothetical protein
MQMNVIGADGAGVGFDGEDLVWVGAISPKGIAISPKDATVFHPNLTVA